MHWPRFAGICLLLVGLLTSCMTPAQARQRVTDVRQTIPEMPRAELLVEEVDEASGSQDNCVGAQYILIYGSDRSFNEILSFYQDELLETGWKDISTDYIVPMFRKGENYFLSVTEEKDLERALLLIAEEHRTKLEARVSEFRTMFMVCVGFTTCPSG